MTIDELILAFLKDRKSGKAGKLKIVTRIAKNQEQVIALHDSELETVIAEKYNSSPVIHVNKAAYTEAFESYVSKVVELTESLEGYSTQPYNSVSIGTTELIGKRLV